MKNSAQIQLIYRIGLRAIILLLAFLAILGCMQTYDNPIDPDSAKPLPPTPQALQLVAIADSRVQILFKYRYPDAATGIAVERTLDSVGAFEPVDTLYADTVYVDSLNLSANTAYRYRLCGVNANGISEYTEEAGVTTLEAAEFGDTSGPYISISHTDSLLKDTGNVFYADTVTLVLSVNDPAGIDSVSVCRMNGKWRKVALAEGVMLIRDTMTEFRNRVMVYAEDSLGNISRDTVECLRDFPNSVHTSVFDTLDGQIVMKWNKYTEKDYRDLRIWAADNYSDDTSSSSARLISSSIGSDTSVRFTPTDRSKAYTFIVLETDSLGQGVLRRSVESYTLTPAGMVPIPSGTFSMGDANNFDSDVEVHNVTLSYSFFMDTAEVTQREYQRVMGNNPSYFTGFANPVEQVTWFDAILYCNQRSNLEGKDTVYRYTGSSINGSKCTDLAGISINFTKNGYRLPTEAEWEYACRAGTTTANYWGNSTSDAAMNDNVWYSANTQEARPVATKSSNQFGLYDMIGNVWEWCGDWDGTVSSTPATDPAGPYTGTSRILRGGSWYDDSYASSLFSSGRFCNDPGNSYYLWGFRAVLGRASVVSKSFPTITVWPDASVLIYGQAVSESVLSNDVHSTPGTFSFASPGMILGAGTSAVEVIFTPSDTGTFLAEGGTVNVTVHKATPSIIVMPTATDIISGQTLGFSSLSGGSAMAGDASVDGLFTFSSSSVVPSLGETVQDVIFTPADTSNYNSVSIPVHVTVGLVSAATDTLVRIAGGTFTMGDVDNAPAHQVGVSSFLMASTECTQREYSRIMGRNPSFFVGNPDLPVEQVTLFDAIRYCNRRSVAEGKPVCYDTTDWTCDINIKGYRLPTEAEWEYSCRAGTTGDYYFAVADTSANAWFNENSGGTTHPVAEKGKNPFGLYDMSGNVREWCGDWYETYSSEAVSDPKGPATADFIVIRGGSWLDYSGTYNLRSASRGLSDYLAGSMYGSDIGFRVVMRL